MSLPENHVVAEGRTLLAAREVAAGQLGVPVNAVEHKLDLAHFKASGSSGAATVKIFAWAKDMASLAPALAAEAWVRGLLGAMGREATVRADMKGGAAVVFVDAGEGARHLVGRQGTTLRAIQHLLERNVGFQFADAQFRLDIARRDDGGDRAPRDDRGPREGRDDRGPRRFDRDDRGPRRDDRGPRRDDRGPRRDDRGPRRDDRPRRQDADALRALARKLGEKVLETGEPEVIRRELNSFDRRLVHLEIQEMSGVASRSVGEGAERRVEIYRSGGGEGAAE
jgi:predicted RNA-binding protein Jag